LSQRRLSWEVFVTYPIVVQRRVFALLGRGWSLSRVAGELGVSERTISMWRAEVGGVIRERPVESGRYLSREERYEIARLHDAQLGAREIARRTGRSAATISRELGRPWRPVGTPGRPGRPAAGRSYAPEACHQAALVARARPRRSKLSQNPRLKLWVQTRLNERDSPEQIAGRLPVEFPDQEEMRISHETIYRAIYVRPRGEVRRELRAHLRTGRDGRHRRASRQTRETRGQIRDAVSIHDRPEDIETRLIPGHYEGDLVVGPCGTHAAIGTLVERTSGHLTAFHLPDKTTRATIAGLTTALTRTSWPMQTLTWDRGKEMAAHATFTIATGIQVYFADPHAPWQRGSNENANGLLREYFPKGLDLATVTDHAIHTAVDQLNNRPRKRLGFRTPNEVLAAILTQDQHNPGVATTT
jgi:transposase, IS30 family